MCGIVGIYANKHAYNGSLKEQVESMVQNLRHRGPDDYGIKLINERICIGNTRLSIVDIDDGHQPLGLGKKLSITYNGEIYNYRELKNKYFSQSKFFTDSDTEVILHVYKKFGLETPSYLNGMFAFCIVDDKKIILARDRIGEKPLYYKVDKNKLVFASEIKVLVDKKEKWSVPEDYFIFETLLDNKTLFNNIYELPPGSYLIYDGTTIKIKKYWVLENKLLYFQNKSEKECVEELRYLVHDAVNIRKTNLPFGVSASGGIDSAIVACIAKPDYLFSSITKNKENSEEKYCDYLGRYLKIPVIKTYPSQSKFISTLPELLRCLDMPVTTLASFPMYLLAKRAGKYVKVLMTGQGADELFGGYARHVLIYVEYLKRCAPELANYQNLASHFWRADHHKNLAQRYLELMARDQTFDLKNIMIKYHHACAGQRPVTYAGFVDLMISFPPLLRADDRISMACSIESRSPFLDHRIIEFSMALPDKLKIKISNNKNDNFFVTKYILRKALRGVVPDLILDRTDKIGYPSPVALWLQNKYSKLLTNLNSNTILPHRIKLLFLNAGDKTRGHYDRSRWQFLQFSIWHMIFIEKKSIADIKKMLKKYV